MLRKHGTPLSHTPCKATVAKSPHLEPLLSHTCFLVLPLYLQALRFSPSLLRIADSVKAKIRASSSSYVAVHMRFEVDAVAYSMCNFGGNESEALKVPVPGFISKWQW